jgi:hypothetical protein
MYTNNTSRSIFVAFVLTLFTTASLFAQNCAHPDYSSLEKLYVATEGDSWANNDGWLANCEPCTWTGIGCDANNRVTSIILRGNGLAGTLPAEVGDLDQLRLLNLAYNEVAGELPATLFMIESLRDINFSGNLFSGELPASVGDQPLLENLRLDNNRLQGELPDALASFTRMEIMILNNNSFTGNMPEGFGDLPFLFNLDLSENDLSGCFPQDLEDLCGNARMRFGGNSKLSWSGDFSSYCLNGFDVDQVGAPCDDGNPDTAGDVITQDCDCSGLSNPNGLTGSGLQTLDEPDGVEAPQESLTRSSTNTTLPTTSQEVSQLTVFPNPVVGDNLSVRLPVGTAQAKLRLMSLTGRVITQSNMNGPSTELALPALNAGVYMLEAVTDGERSVQRIVIQ